MSIMMKVFIYLTFIAVFVAVLSLRRTVEPPIEEDEVDAQMESIRSGVSVWSDFTSLQIGSIVIGVTFLALTLWFIDFVFGNLDVIWAFIHRVLNF